LVFLAIFASVLVGRVFGLSQVRLRLLLTFSSINHMGWILSAFILGFKLIIFYFFAYLFLLGAVVFFFSKLNLYHVNQIFSSSFSVGDSSLIFFNLLSLGGLPPFFGFLPKWCVLQSTVELGFYFLSLSLILSRLIVLYFYLRLTFSAFILKKFVWLEVSKITLSFEILFFNLFSLGGLTLSFLM
jgi:NADH-ubiquinone oxidoreductase chain 2